MESRKRLRRTHIPFEIVTKIILQLPCKSLMRFRSVSKQWRSSIDDKCFVNKYNENLRKTVNRQRSYLVYLRFCRRRSVRELHFYDIGDDGTCSHTRSSLVSNLYQKILQPSCGLVCLHGTQNRSIAVYNPMSGMTTTLPDYPEPYQIRSNETKGRYCLNMLGFGFDPQSNKYKVIQLVRDTARRGVSGCYILTVGCVESSWRRVEAFVDCNACCIFLEATVFCADGVLYWEDHRSDIDFIRIIAFNLNSERFRVIQAPLPVPKYLQLYPRRGLVVLHGKLCSVRVVPQSESGLVYVDVSELKKNSEGNEEWVHLYKLEFQPNPLQESIPMYFPLCVQRDWILVVDYRKLQVCYELREESGLYSYHITEKHHKGQAGRASINITHGLHWGGVVVHDGTLAI